MYVDIAARPSRMTAKTQRIIRLTNPAKNHNGWKKTMTDVICNNCNKHNDEVYCIKCWEDNYQDGYEKGRDDAIAAASEIKQ